MTGLTSTVAQLLIFFIFDRHLFRARFVDLHQGIICLADNSEVIASETRDVVLPFNNADIRPKSVLPIPGLGYNLVSVGRPAHNDIRSVFWKEDFMSIYQA